MRKGLVAVVAAFAAWFGVAAGVEMEATVSHAGATVAASPTQAVFFPAQLSWAEWRPSPLWVTPPKPFAKGVPEGWKGLTVRFGEVDCRPQATIRVPEGTDLYGTGEVLGPLRRNGTDITLWNTDNYGYRSYDPRRLYQSHPWVLGVRPDGTAFGVIADSTYRGRLELTDDLIRFTFDGGPFPVLILEAPTPQDALRQLAALTGTSPLPPLWALGYQQSRWGYKDAAACLSIAKTMRERDIPCDVMWMDIDYMRGHRVFTFDPKGHPDPKGYMAALHDLGFKGVWMIDPALKHEPNAGYEAYDEADRLGLWVKRADGKTDYVGNVWPGPCKFPDFLRADVREWWAERNRRFVAENAIDGLWNDMNEPAVFGGLGHTMPADNLHGGHAPGDFPPGSHLRYHNIYGLLMIQATRDGLLRAHPDRRPFVLTRANFLGGHRYGYTWTGDNLSTDAHMRLSVPMSLSLSLSGQPFSGPDLGGFGNHCTPELMRQWVGFGAFFPFCRNHAAHGTRSQEPWALGADAEAVFRTAIRRRYALMPYLYTALRATCADGSPFMAPVFFADPKDPTLRREEQAFMLGEDLIVVPTFAKAPALPKGDWRVARVLRGDASEAAPDHARLLVRPGAAIPTVKPARNTADLDLADLRLLANPGPDGVAVATLYEDAGDGFGHERGDFRLTRFTITFPKDGGEPAIAAEHLAGNRPTACRRVTAVDLRQP